MPWGRVQCLFGRKIGSNAHYVKNYIGEGGEGECLLLVLTLSCLFYPPPTHFHQTISLSNAEVKVCISYRSSWNRQGLCEMNIIARRAGAPPGWLYLSLHNTATLSPLSFSPPPALGRTLRPAPRGTAGTPGWRGEGAAG